MSFLKTFQTKIKKKENVIETDDWEDVDDFLDIKSNKTIDNVRYISSPPRKWTDIVNKLKSTSNISNKEEVCVMNLADKEWCIIDNDQQNDNNPNNNNLNKDKVTSIEPLNEVMDDGYVLVQDQELTEALSDFIARTLKQYPECNALDLPQLEKMLKETFSQLQEPSTFTKIYDWGQFLYSTYGWTTCLYGIYMEPQMAKFVFSHVTSAVKYVLVLLF